VEQPFTDAHKEILDKENAEMGGDGERVLAFAICHLEP
jgi:hypothetical protein